MKNTRRYSSGLRYGTSQRRERGTCLGSGGSDSRVEGVNLAMAWQAGWCVQGLGKQALLHPRWNLWRISGLGGLDFHSILSPSDLTRLGILGFSDKFTHL